MMITGVSERKLYYEMESVRDSLVEKYEETGNFRDKDVYNLSKKLDKHIINYMRDIKR